MRNITLKELVKYIEQEGYIQTHGKFEIENIYKGISDGKAYFYIALNIKGTSTDIKVPCEK